MTEIGDQLAKLLVELVRAGATLPVAAGLCWYFMISLVRAGSELARDDPWYWFCFGFAAILGSIGCVAIARFVYTEWRERGMARGGG